MYKMISDGSVLRLDDMANIPFEESNRDYSAYKKWVADGHSAAPADLPSRDEIMSRQSERIKAERDRRIQFGGFQVGDKWFHSDTFSRTQQIGLDRLGTSIPAGTMWKTMDGSEVLMTAALAGQIFIAAVASDIAIFSAAKAHKAAMEASDTPGSYDYLSGWPKAFGEP